MKANLTGNGLVDALAVQIEKSIEYLYSPGGIEENRRKPDVYKNILPVKSKTRRDENEFFPHVLIQYIGEEIKEVISLEKNIASVYIVSAVAADEYREYGIEEVINCLTRIKNDLLEKGYVSKEEYKPGIHGPFKVVRNGMTLTIPQEQNDPKFHGYLKVDFEIPLVQQKREIF